MTGLDKWVIGFVILMVVAGIVVPIVTRGPLVMQCTQAALDLLQQADEVDRSPPRRVADAIKAERIPLSVEVPRMLIFETPCYDAYSQSHFGALDGELLIDWFNLRFGEETLIALYASGTEVGWGPRYRGISVGARMFYGRKVTALSDEELKCLVQKSRFPHYGKCGNSGG